MGIEIAVQQGSLQANSNQSGSLTLNHREYIETILTIEHILKEQSSLVDTLDKILQYLVTTSPYPGNTYARIHYRELTRQTPGFIESMWCDKCAIEIHGETLGTVEIHYTEDMQPSLQNPDIREESNLLEYTAMRLCAFIESSQQKTEIVNLSKRLIVASESEKKRLSRDIHDGLGQLLTGLRMEIQTLQNQFNSRNVEANSIQHGFDRLDGIAENMQKSVHQLCESRRAQALSRKDLSDAIRELIDAVFSSVHIDVNFRSDIGNRLKDEDKKMDLYRIAQECVTNIVRHANAHKVEISCTAQTDWVVLRISDDGKGFKPKSIGTERGFGLLSMHERARTHNGTLSINSNIGKGTEVIARLPIDHIENTSSRK